MASESAREPLANLNGTLMPLSEVRISPLDRGFLFGDAIYEVLRVYGGKPWLEEEHWHRLKRSLEAIRLGSIDLERLRRRMHETLKASTFQEAIVYLQITRGAAPRSHPFPTGATPLELLWVQDYHDAYAAVRQTGVQVLTAPDVRWERCDIKSTNLLPNVLAMQAAKEAGCHEAVLYLADGTLTEGTHSNLFGVREGTVLTAPSTNLILPGITRGLIIQLSQRCGIPVTVESLNRAELGDVSELFLSGTTTEVLPVICVDGHLIGNGTPGPVTKRLQQAYREAVVGRS